MIHNRSVNSGKFFYDKRYKIHYGKQQQENRNGFQVIKFREDEIMTINGISGTNAQTAQMGMNQAMDSYSKNIQNQIANAQKRLQELSSSEGMTLEEKMKEAAEYADFWNSLSRGDEYGLEQKYS